MGLNNINSSNQKLDFKSVGILVSKDEDRTEIYFLGSKRPEVIQPEQEDGDDTPVETGVCGELGTRRLCGGRGALKQGDVCPQRGPEHMLRCMESKGAEEGFRVSHNTGSSLWKR